MSSPQHILVIPYPTQGHILPLMDLSCRLADHGFRVTFVNTTYNHDRVACSMDATLVRIHLVSISDELDTQEERDTPGKLSESVLRVLPGKFEELVDEIIRKDEEGGIDCIIADQSLGWALDIAAKKDIYIRRAAFCPAAAAQLVIALSVPKLIADGIITGDGTPIGKQRFKLAQGMPELCTQDLVWSRLGNQTVQKHIFHLKLNNTNSTHSTQMILCNSSLDLEPGTFAASPKNLLPVGPLCTSSSSFSWPVDSSSSLEWLIKHEPGSVTYVAFGSLTLLNKDQVEELALGLEMSNRPFLWATTRDCSFPEGWAERPAGLGKVVGWTNQREVLKHPSIGCFLSHCGWNSIIEGVSNGVPFLCYPQFGDQFLNKIYICDVWRIGVELRNEDGIVVTRREIKDKVDKIFGEDEYRISALEMKRLVRASVDDGGISKQNFNYFVDWIKVS